MPHSRSGTGLEMRLGAKPGTGPGSGPRWIDGAPTLLFERLLSADAERQGQPFKVHDGDGLRQSILESLVALFETRLSVDRDVLARRERTVIDYGVPDFSHRSPRNPEDLNQIGRDLEEAVAWFEPRLGEVKIRVEQSSLDVAGIVAIVSGKMRIGRIVESVTFTMPVSMSGTSSDVG